jgi:hypothetical protein
LTVGFDNVRPSSSMKAATSFGQKTHTASWSQT